MRLLPFWLHRADCRAPALLLAGRALEYGDLLALPGRGGLSLLRGDASEVALGLAAAGLGGGTAFPLSPALEPRHRDRLVALAEIESAAPAAPALIIATSGSEGAPKGVKLPWRAIAAAARMSAAAMRLAAGDVWLAVLPLHHVGGAMILYRCWRSGAAALLHEGFDAAAVLRDLHDRGVTHLSLVPPMLAALLEVDEPPPARLKCVLVGGAALSAGLFERALRRRWPLCPTYGMTETCAQATLWIRPALHEWREGAVGAPLPGVEVGVSAQGTLRLLTPARMSGYLGQPRAGRWIDTRDRARVDTLGRVHVAGRADEVLVSAGVNIHPVEVEHRMSACPGVRQAGVAGLPDPVWGDILAMAYEGEASEDAVATWCRASLPASRRPRRFLRVERLPLTASGKLDRRSLPALFGGVP
ncbi:MAG: AMP-binding protein [Betaproteobacteria bacterium]|nr:AMP-binding protein [Betaproteobacteria bacterium]